VEISVGCGSAECSGCRSVDSEGLDSPLRGEAGRSRGQPGALFRGAGSISRRSWIDIVEEKDGGEKRSREKLSKIAAPLLKVHAKGQRQAAPMRHNLPLCLPHPHRQQQEMDGEEGSTLRPGLQRTLRSQYEDRWDQEQGKPLLRAICGFRSRGGLCWNF